MKGQPTAAPPSKQDSRPAYATGQKSSTGESETKKPRQILHIVRGTDTLEKLAERYLGDAGRALEIFDLNSDQLSNPHLLPIGAELRIPVEAGRSLD